MSKYVKLTDGAGVSAALAETRCRARRLSAEDLAAHAERATRVLDRAHVPMGERTGARALIRPWCVPGSYRGCAVGQVADLVWRGGQWQLERVVDAGAPRHAYGVLPERRVTGVTLEFRHCTIDM